ncbi:phage tail protein [Arsenicibacter rosenii]|uniref:Phage tail protein n=1 Tax=Arsenicibacter rosenii TaxID=1750698 RepID=A0A1S2VCF9_9BACT|nr:tail fiber protein [Arsenicibacter rosenii]OIN55995.1 phage tail protein [Arsenicibacter rosenii]
MDPILGTIVMFGFNFAPVGYLSCNGQQLGIQQNAALYSLLGVTYGGNGTTNFNLPDLRGRLPIGFGQGPGLSNYPLGQKAGSETSTLTVANLPAHTHALNAYAEGPAGNVAGPAGALPANTGGLDPEYRTSGTIVQMAPQGVGLTGAGQAFSNMPPYLAVNYCIASEGIYPQRP